MTAKLLNPDRLAPELLERFKKIRLLAMDVDGVLTQGEIIYTSSGEEMKSFNVKDGLGISLAIKHNLAIALVTARNSSITERRAKELGIPLINVKQGQKNKQAGLETLLNELSLKPEEAAYIGDDLPDMPALRLAGLACCPADAVDAVKEICHWVSTKNGGCGAVRELIDLILAAQDKN